MRPGAVAFQVTDTGIGILEAQLDTIFDEFVQVDQTLARRQGGTGLASPLHGGWPDYGRRRSVTSIRRVKAPDSR